MSDISQNDSPNSFESSPQAVKRAERSTRRSVFIHQEPSQPDGQAPYNRKLPRFAGWMKLHWGVSLWKYTANAANALASFIIWFMIASLTVSPGAIASHYSSKLLNETRRTGSALHQAIKTKAILWTACTLCIIGLLGMFWFNL